MLSQAGTATPWPTRAAYSLESAYGICEAITKQYSKSFYFASSFLPDEKRRAIRALYAFCRWTDDIVDVPQSEPEQAFDRWSAAVAARESDDHNNPVLMAWNDTRARYRLPTAVIEDLLAGVLMDFDIQRYQSYEELWLYCYRVAATVGILSMHIIGFEEGATPYAIKLGVALQLTNILRDVGEDAQRGRIYLPLDEVARFGLTEEDLFNAVVDERYRALIQFQIARAERLYDEAWPGIQMLHRDGQFAVATAARVYRAILPEIVAHGYDNHNHRAFVPTRRKLLMLPSIWWGLRR